MPVLLISPQTCAFHFLFLTPLILHWSFSLVNLYPINAASLTCCKTFLQNVPTIHKRKSFLSWTLRRCFVYVTLGTTGSVACVSFTWLVAPVASVYSLQVLQAAIDSLKYPSLNGYPKGFLPLALQQFLSASILLIHKSLAWVFSTILYITYMSKTIASCFTFWYSRWSLEIQTALEKDIL